MFIIDKDLFMSIIFYNNKKPSIKMSGLFNSGGADQARTDETVMVAQEGVSVKKKKTVLYERLYLFWWS